MAAAAVAASHCDEPHAVLPELQKLGPGGLLEDTGAVLPLFSEKLGHVQVQLPQFHEVPAFQKAPGPLVAQLPHPLVEWEGLTEALFQYSLQKIEIAEGWLAAHGGIIADGGIPWGR